MMPWSPVSGTIPQYQKSDGTLASDYYIKFYKEGMTPVVPINMSTDDTGGTTLEKAKINSSGYPVNGSGDVFMPHIDQDYKIALYKNSTDADNNTTANADWIVDIVPRLAMANELTTLKNNLTVDDYTELKALTSANLSDGDLIWVTDDFITGPYVVVTGTVTNYNAIQAVFNDDANRYAKRRYSGGLHVNWFGALPTLSSPSTTRAGIQDCIDYSTLVGLSYGNGSLVTSPNNFAIGVYPEINFTWGGAYLIDDALNYGAYHVFKGWDTIIQQNDNTKDIFFSQSIYFNSWRGFKLVGGRTQIHAQNTTGTGIEGVLIDLDYVDFNASASGNYSLRCLFGPTAGGEQAKVNNCRFVNFDQAIESTFDLITIDTCWFETSDGNQTNDTAWINVDQANVENSVFVPAGNYNQAAQTTRYFDFTNGLSAKGNRFGAEGGGGMPIAYCFGDAATGGYPYQNGGRFVFKDNPAYYTGGSNRTDTGLIVLKTGIPKTISIEGNQGSADGPHIRCDLMTSTTLPTYLATLSAQQDRLSISVRNYSKWASSLTESSANDLELAPYTVYESFTTGDSYTQMYGMLLQDPTSPPGTITVTTNVMREHGNGKVALTYSTNSGFTGMTALSNNTCDYVKLGKKVHMSGGFYTDSTETSLSEGDSITLTGLPFPEAINADTPSFPAQQIGTFTMYDSLGAPNMGFGAVISNTNDTSIQFFLYKILGTLPGAARVSYTIDYVEA